MQDNGYDSNKGQVLASVYYTTIFFLHNSYDTVYSAWDKCSVDLCSSLISMVESIDDRLKVKSGTVNKPAWCSCKGDLRVYVLHASRKCERSTQGIISY